MGGTNRAMPEDLLSTPNGRAGLSATLHLASEAVLRQLCLNRGLETYNKTRSELEQNISTLIGALDEAGVNMPGRKTMVTSYSPAAATADEDESASWQESMLREQREDKQTIEALQAELEGYRQAEAAEAQHVHDCEMVTASLAQAQARVKELWNIAETEASDRMAFFSDLEHLVQPTPQVLSAYDKEIARLSEMMPLIECVSRRDFVLHKLRECMRNVQHSVSQKEQMLRAEFGQELQRLNEQLSSALTAFEKRYGRRFLWKGEYILEFVQMEISQQIEASKISAAHNTLDKIAQHHGITAATPPYSSRSPAPAEPPARELHAVVNTNKVISPRAQIAMERARGQRELALGALAGTARITARGNVITGSPSRSMRRSWR